MKPSTALVVENKPFYYPEFSTNIHYECEVVLKIAKTGKHIQEKFAKEYYKEISLGIDFTARDVQDACKQKGHPWEIAKAFDGSAPIGFFIPIEEARQPDGHIHFSLKKNDETVQSGNTADLIFDFDALICHISKYFTLNRGDLISTGTPAGVGPTKIGDVLTAFVGDKKMLETAVK